MSVICCRVSRSCSTAAALPRLSDLRSDSTHSGTLFCQLGCLTCLGLLGNVVCPLLTKQIFTKTFFFSTTVPITWSEPHDTQLSFSAPRLRVGDAAHTERTTFLSCRSVRRAFLCFRLNAKIQNYTGDVFRLFRSTLSNVNRPERHWGSSWSVLHMWIWSHDSSAGGEVGTTCWQKWFCILLHWC